MQYKLFPPAVVPEKELIIVGGSFTGYMRLDTLKKHLSSQTPIQRSHSLEYRLNSFLRAYRTMFVPYLRSRLARQLLRPLPCFLYTDLNCNLDCYYCYSRGKNIPRMTMDVARDSVDWLERNGCKVLAYMGGDPLVRKDSIIELTRYAAQKGFFVYLPTNGVLLDREFVQEIGKAGISAINLAVDSVDKHPGIPKYFNRIRSRLEYLVEMEQKYNYITFLNINITDENVDDVRRLTETAHAYGIPTDYHINEPPVVEYKTYRHRDKGKWITEKRLKDVDELVDWLIKKNIAGYTMVNSVDHLRAMKKFIRHELRPWPCRAGINSLIIRLDGSFAPCFELYGSTEDWGNIYDGPRFDPDRLAGLKARCAPRCLSTCNYQLAHYYQSVLWALQWVVKHAYSSILGVS